MATTITGARVGVALAALLSKSLDIGSVDYPANWSPAYSFDNGTGAGQANMLFTDERTLSASASEDLDLAGGITDAFGDTITFTKIKAIIIQAAAGNTNNVLVGGAAAAIAGLFGDVADVQVIRPGGLYMIVAPDATGIAVAAGTADDLKIANSAGSSSVTYKIAVLGVV